MESPHGPLCTGDVTMPRGLCYYCPHDLMFIAHLSNELRPGVLGLMGLLHSIFSARTETFLDILHLSD